MRQSLKQYTTNKAKPMELIKTNNQYTKYIFCKTGNYIYIYIYMVNMYTSSSQFVSYWDTWLRSSRTLTYNSIARPRLILIQQSSSKAATESQQVLRNCDTTATNKTLALTNNTMTDSNFKAKEGNSPCELSLRKQT